MVVLMLPVNCSRHLVERKGMRRRVLQRALVASPSCAWGMMAGRLSDAHATVDGCKIYRRFRAASRDGTWRKRRRGCSFCPEPAHGEVLLKKGIVEVKGVRAAKMVVAEIVGRYQSFGRSGRAGIDDPEVCRSLALYA